MKIRHHEDYRPLRATAYPPIGDQLDAIYKLAQALAVQGFVIPAEVQAWIDKCKKVKATYPKL